MEMKLGGSVASMHKLVNRKRWLSRSAILVAAFFCFWFGYFALFWSRAIEVSPTGDLMVGHINMWGDWAAHFTMGSAMGYRQLFLSDSPFLLGARFSYPFAANFISAVLIRLGVPFFTAFVFPSFIMSVVLVGALFYFFKTLLSNKVLAVVASLIFLLNGGLGFYYFAQDILASPEPLQTVINPPHEYTRLDDQNIKWISVIDSMVIPQRAFNLGFPIALLALGLIHNAIFHKTKHPTIKLLLAGIFIGVLPLVHTHSFLAAGIVLCFWFLSDFIRLKKRNTESLFLMLRPWIIVGAMSLVLAGPLFYFFFYNQTQGFITWHPGWLALDFKMNWLWFWFKNWLITPFLGLAGLIVLIKKTKPSQQLAQTFIWLPFLLIFILANLFLFQPFAWDNTKLLVWSAVGIAGLATIFLHALISTKKNSLKILAGLLFILTITSGTIDAYWIVRTDLHTYRMYTAEELALAEWVKTQTPANAIWLTGDQHNHWLFNLTGRQTVMTYKGWLWTHGYEYLPSDQAVRQMYSNPKNRQLFEQYGINYVVIGPNERSVWNADFATFANTFTLIHSTKSYQIFSTSD